MPKRTVAPASTFAYAFGITPKKKDDWFDPKLHVDTQLFIDPFLMFETTSGPWATVHSRMIAFFNEALGLIAAAGGDHRSKEWRQASTMLSFPEPPQFCLGYGKATIFGRGSRDGLGRGMLEAGERAVRAGIHDVRQFGELMIFGENFGPDRISDMTCNIVMDLFIDYTQEVTKHHGIPTEAFTLPHSGFDLTRGRWRRSRVELPRNPCWDRRTPVLLVPEDYLIDLPVMDDGAFWDWVYDNFGQQLRTELNMELDASVDKQAIIGRAKQSPGVARRYGIRYEERYRERPPQPYDLNEDRRGLTKPLHGAQFYASEGQVQAPQAEIDVPKFVQNLAADLKWIVEHRGLWKNFWAGGTPLAEPHIQQLFDNAAVLKCRDLDIDLTRESDAGRGPVDFKFSAGWRNRTILEVKFAKSTSFWDNLDQQPKTYAFSEGVSSGVFLVIQHLDRHCTPEWEAKAGAALSKVAEKSGVDLSIVFVDARPKDSASNLKADRDPKEEG